MLTEEIEATLYDRIKKRRTSDVKYYEIGLLLMGILAKILCIGDFIDCIIWKRICKHVSDQPTSERLRIE